MEAYLLKSISFIFILSNIFLNVLLKDKQVSAYSTPRDGKIKSSSMKEAVKYMMETERKNAIMMYGKADSEFQYRTNLTDKNRDRMMKGAKEYSAFYSKARRESRHINWKSFKDKNYTLYRWFSLFHSSPPDDVDIIREFKSMDRVFDQARVCPYKQYKSSRNGDKCSLQLYPDLVNVFATSINPSELAYYWSKFRDVTGKKMRNIFINSIEKSNKGAKKIGFKDYGDSWIAQYESKTFKEDMASLMEQVRPLYEQLHAYVRRRLKQFYNKTHIENDGPIPAHLLGNDQAQWWSGIFNIVNPYPEYMIPSITKIMIEKNLKPLDIFAMAEEFYVSMGLEHMTPTFWRKSLIEKPTDREVICSGKAFNLMDGKDFRIAMCTQVNDGDMFTVYHEMGHIEYCMLCSNLPTMFQTAPNPGFHEAVGDSMILSVSNMAYLEKSGLIEENVKKRKNLQKHNEMKENIIMLMKSALRFIPMVPYCYIIDLYRYGAYNGSIKKEELNKMWWKYRNEYQGICPPVKRTERDWDPGAKLHIAKNIEFMRYFVSNIFTFQMHKYLCKEAGYTGPLHKCSIYKSKKAGRLLRKVLSPGSSKPWQEFMAILTKNETSSLDAEPLLEYYQPLMEWLKKKNRGHLIGWKSENVMLCPCKKMKNKEKLPKRGKSESKIKKASEK